MKKEILNNEFCPEKWNEMAKVKNGRFCSKCEINLTDLSNLTIKEIAKKHYGRGKCVALNNDQIDFIVNYRRIKTIAFASSLFIGTTFFNVSYGQSTTKNLDSCLIKGKVIVTEGEKITDRAIYIYLKNSDSIYETRTNQKGEFSINLPKNSEIEHSNVSKLISKKTKNKKQIIIRNVKLKPVRRNPGFF